MKLKRRLFRLVTRALLYPLSKMYPGGMLVGVRLNRLDIEGQNVLITGCTIDGRSECEIRNNIITNPYPKRAAINFS